MVQAPPESIWLVCPDCGSRIEVRSGAVQTQVRCSHCGHRFVVRSTTKPTDKPALVAAAAETSTASAAFAAAPKAIADDEIRVGPPLERTGYIPRIPKPEEMPERPPPETYVAPPAGTSLAWTFLSGVLDFAFRPQALAQWMFLSIGTILAAEITLFSIIGYLSAGQSGGVGGGASGIAAGCFGIVAFFLVLFTLSYAAASLVSIVENTAYNLDKAADWPEADWRERLFLLLRMAYLAGLAGLVGAGLAWVGSLATEFNTTLVAVAVVVLFPVLLLSVLETNSMWPLSPPVWRSLLTGWYAWAAFYLLSGAMWAGWFFLTKMVWERSTLLTPIVAGPVWAAGVFAYARLLGRLAWLLMRKAESESDRPGKFRTAHDFIVARRPDHFDIR